jgi:hypothetical protein
MSFIYPNNLEHHFETEGVKINSSCKSRRVTSKIVESRMSSIAYMSTLPFLPTMVAEATFTPKKKMQLVWLCLSCKNDKE